MRSEAIDGGRRGQEGELRSGRSRRDVVPQQLPHGVLHELEAGDGEKPHDSKRAKRLELVVPVRMIFIGSAGGQPDQDHRDHVVDRVERGVHRRPDHRKRARAHADDNLDDDDEEVQDQDQPERPLDRASAQSAASSSAPFR
jgi:hypothetical protein